MALLIKVDAENLICHHIIMDQTHLNADDRHGPYFHERAFRWCNHCYPESCDRFRWKSWYMLTFIYRKTVNNVVRRSFM